MKKRKNSLPIKMHTPKESFSGVSTSTKSESFYTSFPYELRYKDEDGAKICWFYDEVHMKKYIDRYKLKSGSYNITDRSTKTS